MLNRLARRAAELIKAHLTKADPSRFLEVRVFGSMARGEARVDSDLDLLILTEGDAFAFEDEVFRAVRLALEALHYPFCISPLVMTKDHFDELLRRERLFARTVIEEGITI